MLPEKRPRHLGLARIAQSLQSCQTLTCAGPMGLLKFKRSNSRNYTSTQCQHSCFAKGDGCEYYRCSRYLIVFFLGVHLGQKKGWKICGDGKMLYPYFPQQGEFLMAVYDLRFQQCRAADSSLMY